MYILKRERRKITNADRQVSTRYTGMAVLKSQKRCSDVEWCSSLFEELRFLFLSGSVQWQI